MYSNLLTFRSLSIFAAAWTALVIHPHHSHAKDRDLTPDSSPVPAVLEVVPDDALAVAFGDNLKQADARFSTFVKRFGANAPPTLAMIQKTFGDGVNVKGSMAIAAFAGKEGGQPAPVGFIPVKDFNAFIKPLAGKDDGDGIWSITIGMESALTARVGDYAVIVNDTDKELLRHVIGAKQALGAKARAMRLCRPGLDAGAIATPAGIKWFVAKATEQLDVMIALIGAGDNPQARQAAAAFEMYKSLAQALGKEVQYAAASYMLDDQGSVRMTARVQLNPKGAWAKAAASLSTPKYDLIAGLPQGDFFMAFGGAMNKEFFVNDFMKLSIKMMKSLPQIYGELTDEQLKEVENLWMALADWQGFSMVFSVPKSGKPFLANTSAIMRVKDAGTFLDRYEKSMKQYNAALKNAPMAPQIKIKRIKVSGIPAIKLDMKMNIPDNPAAPQLKNLFGPDGVMTAYLAAVGESKVAIAYSSKENLKRSVAEALKPGLAADKNLITTKKLLLKNPHATGFISPKGAIAFFNYIMSVATPGVVLFELPPFDDCPPVGVAVSTSATTIDIDAVLPDDTITALGRYIEKVKAMQAAGLRWTEDLLVNVALPMATQPATSPRPSPNRPSARDTR
jgi:hypothetical protein